MNKKFRKFIYVYSEDLKKQKGITLIALIITIVILLILAGISIQAITSDNGLFKTAKQAKQTQIESEMKESLSLAISDLLIEKEGSATVNHITQEWTNEKLNEYNPKVRDANDGENQEKTITLTKSGITKKYKIKTDLSIEEMDVSGITLEYEIGPKEGDKVNISIKISAEEGLKKIQTPEPDTINCNGKKEVGLDYKVEYGEEYIFTITTESGKEKQEKILVLPEIEISEPTVNTSNSTSVTTSNAENSVEKARSLYINFNILTEGITYKIKYNNEEITMPYEVSSNNKYIFEVEVECKGQALTTKTVEVVVKQYMSAQGVVAYSAGDWTETEIQELKNLGLYNLNDSVSTTLEVGLNFKFEGFTNKESDYAKKTNIITSKDESVKINPNGGFSKYDGWKILESKEENGKTYVTKIIHAGCPENFVFLVTNGYEAYQGEYLLSGGMRQTSFDTFNDGRKINVRNWDMYRDKTFDQKGYIEDIHCMTYQEAILYSQERITGYNYWLASNYYPYGLFMVYSDGRINSGYAYGAAYSYGIRPVVSLKSGVYIDSGTGTEGDPYILAME